MVKMMNSTNVANQSTSPSPTSDESTSSEFQILNAPPSNLNGTYSHLNDLRFSIANAVFDVPVEDVQNQLRELLNENVELKDMLQQNNVAMGEQFNKLLKWREDMTAIQERHKTKFEETRLLIQQLRSENAELGKQVQRLESNRKENETMEAGMIVLKKQFAELERSKEKLSKESDRLSIVELQLKKDLSTVQSQFDALKVKHSRMLVEKQELVAINNELSSKLAACQSLSPVRAMNALEMSNVENNLNQPFVMVSPVQPSSSESNLRNNKVAITELLLQLHFEQERASELANQLLEEQKKTSSLKQELERSKQQPPAATTRAVAPSRAHPSSEVLNELKESELTLNMATNYLERYKERCTSLENWLGENQTRLDILGVAESGQQVQQLRDEMGSLRRMLAEEQTQNQEDKKNLLEARQKFELLLKDYQELLKSWDSYQHEQNSRGQQSEAYYEIQIKKLNEQIDNLTAKLVCNEETLQNKVDEIGRLRSQTRFSSQELERIPILQAQVDLYQSDFRAVRENHDKLLSDNAKLATENEKLRVRIRQIEHHLTQQQRCMYVEQTPGRQTIYAGGTTNMNEFDGGGGKREGGGTAEVGRTSSSSFGASRSSSTSASSGNASSNLLDTSKERDKLRTTKSEHPKPSAPDDNVYYCPKCNMGFTDFKPLENHVDQCLDNDDPFLS